MKAKKIRAIDELWKRPPQKSTPPVDQRFWNRVRRGKDDECWPWTGYVHAKGYGVFNVRGRHFYAHRLAWYFSRNSWPDMKVCHACDNPICCNPDHLWLGTDIDNSNDKVRKSRQTRGTLHPCHKLNDAAVLEMRVRYAAGTSIKKLAGEYGVSKTLVSLACTGQRWKHVVPLTGTFTPPKRKGAKR